MVDFKGKFLTASRDFLSFTSLTDLVIRAMRFSKTRSEPAVILKSIRQVNVSSRGLYCIHLP